MNDNFDYKNEFERLQTYINSYFNKFFSKYRNKNIKLYDAFEYAINGGGKRIRPILTMITAAAIGNEPENAVTPALAIEILHNFTLLHDDIMDNASIRHGQPSVHKKWNSDIAILSGDMMIGYAYTILYYDWYYKTADDAPMLHVKLSLINTLTEALIKVCEGQELDTNFNTAISVSMDDYLKMVELKTSALLCCAVQMGAEISEANFETQSALNNYALYLGIAFQIQDDMLDFNANNIKFGKKLGQDAFENKKTFPIIKAKELATDKADIDFINRYYQNKISITDNDVNTFIQIFNKLNIPEIAENTITSYIEKSKQYLSILPKNNYTEMLYWFLYYILKREY
ncbi:MAG: polyprenyl synthetase family protein [Bacteroidetes bacterium]|nr:polyprenyl synthetase family protein [Bacteroidota bacterium]